MLRDDEHDRRDEEEPDGPSNVAGPEVGSGEIVMVPTSAIRNNGSTQSRATTSADAVKEYAQAIAGGAEFPRPVLYRDEDGNYWPGDGHHTIL